jgi:hypothetical protein
MSKLQLIFLTKTGFIFSVNSQATLTQRQNYSDELAEDTPLVYPDPFYEPSPEDIMMNFREASRYH